MREYISSLAHEEIFNPDESRGLKYLRERDIDEKTIRDWKLGYCPSHVRDLIFNDRITIPYRDQYGKQIAIAVRKVEGEKPVWWNESFEKGKYLFGLDKAKKSIYKNNLAIVVEGQFDVISLHKNGIDAAVGVCGADFNLHRLSMLSRYCNRVILAFDSDDNRAGQTSSDKTFKLLKDRNMHVFKWFFPKGKDPDLYVREKGGEICRQQIRKIVKSYKMKDRSNYNSEYYFG